MRILLVDDNPGDARLIREALREGHYHADIDHVEDGVEAMHYLRHTSQYQAKSRPGLVLLDLNMPRKDGREVLSEIKNDPELKSIPVIILTTSDAESDISLCYQNHANCYLTKPVELDDFIKLAGLIHDFWLSAVKLPRH